MSIILFIVGAGLLGVGAVKLGNIELEGGRVRAAGITLMTPFVAYLLLFQIVNGLTNGDASALSFVSFLEFAGIIGAGSIAYMLLFRSSENGQVTILPKPQAKTPPSPKAEEEPAAPVESVAPPKPVSRPTPRPTRLKDFPTVMTTAEAAQYLDMTEQAVLELIEEGKLTAARINYRYRISRTVLDEFIKKQNN